MLRTGRTNWIVVALTALIVVIVGLLFFVGESPTTTTNRFFIALAKGDSAELAEVTVFSPPKSKEEAKAAWDKTFEYSRHYRFVWKITGHTNPAPDRATVRFKFVKNALRGSAYEENYDIDLLKVDGKWKVAVDSVDREIFPALPR
ncbi:MAG: hypothetical protein KIT11_06885 [Fimbriimonadaceae bacterium]|nr:hypothetical protein [Fimbriimonadaceae bacterium]QYK56077.1 MAG: hypothetical protein KF733_01075 [Fimbriimonadaceae bacterium]